MLTIKEVLLRTSAFFESKGITNPRLNAELVLACGLALPSRLEIYLQHDRPLEECELEQVRPLVKRRAKGEPIQYIEGRANFMGMDFQVDDNVLIPRPETEELVEKLYNLYENDQPSTILDLGTGSGILAISLAKHFTDALATAVDLSPQALSIASENANIHEIADRVTFLESDWYSKVDGKFDLIVSNPPYLTECELVNAEKEVREFEPTLALVASGEYGEESLFKVLEGAISHINPGGIVAMETGISQHSLLMNKTKSLGFTKYWGEKDLLDRDRFFFAQL